MNDFTIEELEKLSLMAIKFSDRFNPNDTDPLCIKLQSMIDNYPKTCKHSSTNFDDGVYYCNDCGHCVP